MPWFQLIITVAPDHVPAVELLLEEAGAVAVALADAAADAIYEPALGTQPLWAQTHVSGLFETAADCAALVAQITQHLGQEPPWQVQNVPDQDWERVWLADFAPLACGTRLWICPHGQPAPDPHAIILWLDPGLAFGTGNHPTTALCLEWLDAGLQAGSTVVDYGCGSGILGLAALRLGAAHCWAVDHDPQALRATAYNAAQNDLTLWVGLPEHLPQLQVDLLLANILARPLVELAAHFAMLVRPAGQIVLAGILNYQENEVRVAYQPWFDFAPSVQREDWIILTGMRR